MKLVIDIPEVFYEYCKAQEDAIEIQLAVKKGTPLPKGHGRLIDADALYENTEICHSDEDGCACVRWKEINDAPTIIEADKEGEDDRD